MWVGVGEVGGCVNYLHIEILWVVLLHSLLPWKMREQELTLARFFTSKEREHFIQINPHEPPLKVCLEREYKSIRCLCDS